MTPSGHGENSKESQDPLAGADQSRKSISSQSSNAPSLSDIIPADGFRPATNTASASPHFPTTSSTTQADQTSQSVTGHSSDRQETLRNRPSSVAKPHRPHESLTLRHEHNNVNNTEPSFARASIASSEGPVIRPDSPYRGPTGPSHPYQMYPQRTLSDVTASAPTPTSSETTPASQQGPTHPYSLYTQSTAEIEETPSRAIPVGFTNLPDNYRRQLGPDGEEAGDLVGPMGHTEELPPYTRYPEIAYVRKESNNDTDSTSAPSTSGPGVPAVASGAGGIGRATRDPEFSSTEEDLVLDRSRPSVRSQSSQASSHNINTAAQEISEKSTRKEKWQRRAKKKLWGIVPYWAICLVMVGMVLMGIIMGAVIGTVLKKSDDKTRKAIAESEEESPPKAPVAEVAPLTVLPDDLDEITTGTWGLPQLDKDEAPRKCFNNSLEFNAWSCDIPFRYYSIDITEIKNASKLANYDLELFAINETDAQFIWGTQPPSVPRPIPLQLVNDTFDMGRGPAWWLNITYNKTVIVPEANFPLPERRAKRSTFDFNEHSASEFDMTRFRKTSKGAVEGDTPWICTWPDTTLEIFIYPNVNASLTTDPSETEPEAEPDYAQPTPPSRGETPTKAYPKVVKFLERRLSGNPNSTAVCRQVNIQPGGWTWEPKTDEDGEPIRVEIVETASAWEEQMVANQKREIVREWYGTTDTSLVRRDQQELTSCGCLWWST